MKKENIHDELAGLSSTLRQMKGKDDGMRLPPDYFSQLQEKMMQQLKEEEPGPAAKTVPFWSVKTSRFRMVAAAASVAVLLTAGWWYSSRPAVVVEAPVAVTEPAPVEETALSSEEAQLYIDENILEFDTEMLAAELVAAEVSENPAEKQTMKNTNKKLHVADEDLEHMLDELTEEELEDLL